MLSYTFYLEFVTYNKSIMTFAPISFPMQSDPLPFASSASVIINDLAYKDSFNQLVIQWRVWVSQRFVRWLGWIWSPRNVFNSNWYFFLCAFNFNPFRIALPVTREPCKICYQSGGYFKVNLTTFLTKISSGLCLILSDAIFEEAPLQLCVIIEKNYTPLSDRKVSGTPPLSLPLCKRSQRRCFLGQSLCSGTIH